MMGWLGNYVRRKLGLLDPGAWRGVFIEDSWSQEPITPETALQVSSFFSCVRLIAQTVGTLPLPLYERRPGGGREVLGDHQLYRVLHDQPNADQNATTYWEGMAASLCLWGNAYSRKVRNAQGVVALQFLFAPQMVVTRERDGRLRYRYHDQGRVEELDEDDVFHVRGFGVGGDLGLSVLGYARQVLGLSRASTRAAARTYSEGMRAKGFFTMPSVMDEEQRKQAQKALVEPFSGPEAKSVGILEGGVKFEATNLSPKDAELLLSTRLTIEEVCRFCGVPPIMVGHASEGQTMWGTGVEALLTQFYTTGLRPILVRIEREIGRSLILPRERGRVYAEFNIEGLLRADATTRASLYSTYVQNGIMNRNEVRAKENLPNAGPAGDVLTVQSNLVPLDQLAPEQRPAAGRPNLRVVP